MKGIIITTRDEISVQEFDQPIHKSLGKAVGGYIEHVRPMFLPRPYCMIVNEEGLLKGLPTNTFGCVLYGTVHHGSQIVGDLVLMKEVNTGDGLDFGGLNDGDIKYLAGLIEKVTHGAMKLPAAVATDG